MKKFALLLLAFLPFFAYAQNDAKAEQIVRGIVYKMKNYSYEGSFNMSFFSAESERTTNENGTMVIDGLRFRLSLADNFILYDGQYHWAYSKDMNEVTVIEPAADELRDVNPIAMIESYMDDYRIKFGEKDNSVDFIPLDIKRDDFFRITLFYDEDKFPVKLIAFNRSGDKTTFAWTEIKSVKVDDSTFVFDSSQFPGVEINDLR